MLMGAVHLNGLNNKNKRSEFHPTHHVFSGATCTPDYYSAGPRFDSLP